MAALRANKCVCKNTYNALTSTKEDKKEEIFNDVSHLFKQTVCKNEDIKPCKSS